MYTESRTRGQSESYGQNFQRLGKDLMTIDELTTMDGNRCILQLRGLRPFFSPKYDLRKHPNFRYTAEADKRNAFDAARLISAKLKIRTDDEFTVYEVEVPDESLDGTVDILNYDDLDDPDTFA
jgi:type IV secretion system protein VirD4